MRNFTFLWLLLAGLAATPALASGDLATASNTTVAATASPTKPDAAAMASALRLARFLYDEDTQVRLAVRHVDTSMGPAFRKQEEFKALEDEYPGFLNALLTEVKPLIADYTRKSTPDYQARIATIYAMNLTAAELDDLLEFYKSPTGRKLFNGIMEASSIDAVLGEAMQDPDADTSYAAVENDHRVAADSAKTLIDKGDEPALIALAKKPYALKVLRLGPEVRRLDHELMNEPEPEFEAEMAKLFEAILARFEAGATASK